MFCVVNVDSIKLIQTEYDKNSHIFISVFPDLADMVTIPSVFAKVHEYC